MTPSSQEMEPPAIPGWFNRRIRLSSEWNWVDEELQRFAGNLIAAQVTLVSGTRLTAMSVYSPAWPVARERLAGIDVAPVKLQHSPDVWVTELLWAALRTQDRVAVPWVVAGDLNSSETFDDLWSGGPHGCREVLDRMTELGFIDCLRRAQGRLTPTFRNPRGGKVIHQMDYLFVVDGLLPILNTCETGDPTRVFDTGMSDHLPIVADFVDS